MSSLQRYKKPGGFIQLVSLIETFGALKREKFLAMIEDESAPWAEALRQKSLTLERVLAWPDEVVIAIFKELPLKSLAFALEEIGPEVRLRFDPFLGFIEKRLLAEALENNRPTADEIQSVLIKVLEIARRRVVQREIASQVIGNLGIPENFEAHLEGPSKPAEVADAAPAQLSVALRENQILKEEVRRLRDKLEQIRRIA